MSGIPYLIIRHDPGATRHDVGGGKVKGIYYFEQDDITDKLKSLIEERGWSRGSYSATPIGITLEHP